MNISKTNIAAKATSLVENHSFLATLLAMLCLAFAVNYFLLGPGSDGGSGFGGTGKAGGESGFGGTGKGPDTGPGFKLGANEQDSLDNDDSFADTLMPDFDEFQSAYRAENLLAIQLPARSQDTAPLPAEPAFDVSMLRLTPMPNPLEKTQANNRPDKANNAGISSVIETITLAENKAIGEVMDEPNMDHIVDNEINQMANQTLFSSQDILNRLMLVEAQASIEQTTGEQSIMNGSTADSQTGIDTSENIALADNTIRNRIALPARPERPDRLSVPARIDPVQRVNIPTPPPVRPMRTLSTLLNR